MSTNAHPKAVSIPDATGHTLADSMAWLCDHTYLERREYCYLGTDDEGRHHHYDERDDTVYVTDRRAERFTPGDSPLPHWRITGELFHVEDLTEHDDKDLRDWIRFVDWDEKVVTLVCAEDVHAATRDLDRGDGR